MWRDADKLLCGKKRLLVLGSNRSSKSTYAGKRVQNVLTRTPTIQPVGQDYTIPWLAELSENVQGRIGWCFHTQELTSISLQQPILWQFMPSYLQALYRLNPSLYHSRKRKPGIHTDVNYTIKNGFPGFRFVLPNQSQCFFFNYRQDRDVVEGGQIDLAWADELIPVDWLERLTTRTVDRRGKIILTFTPVRGYSDTVAEFLNGARIVEWKDCRHPYFKGKVMWPGGKAGRVPYIAECLNGQDAVIWFHAFENPFLEAGWQGFIQEWSSKSEAQQKIVVFGITQKTTGSKFPKFGKHNILSPDKVPKFLLNGTNYHLMDFAWMRNWFMLWVRVCINPANRRKYYYVYREWPDFETYGAWFEPSGQKADGVAGPAQEVSVSGPKEYATLTKALESQQAEESVYRRFGDARTGAMETAVEEGGALSILEQLSGVENFDVEPVVCADGTGLITEGVNLINELLAYDESAPFSPANEPRLFISSQCHQLIESMRNWTGRDGQKGASKDPIDVLRYAVVMDLDHADPNEPISRGKGRSY